MIAYSDGTPAQTGDRVTVDDGEHTGTVKHVIASASDIEEWRVEAPGLMIDTSYGGLVFYPLRSLNGVALAQRHVDV